MCLPRFATEPTPGRASFADRILWVADRLRHPFMPWQEQVARVAAELIVDEETGLLVPAYSEVIVTVPWQAGKTLIDLAWMFDRAAYWEAWDGKQQAIVYTAQNGSEASGSPVRAKARAREPPQTRTNSHAPHLPWIFSGVRRSRNSGAPR